MNRFLLPKERIPKPFNQNIVDEKGKIITNVGSCVACTFTKILEVIHYVKTGEYIELSKGYMYGRNNYPGKRNAGMNEEYTLDVLLKRGTVPESMCTDYDEIPDIISMLECREDIDALDLYSEKYKLDAWRNISGNNSKELFENLKYELQLYLMPIAVTMPNYKQEKHCVVAIGCEDDNILWLDHDGTDNINSTHYSEFNRAYFLDGRINMSEILPFTDVKETDWFYPYVKEVYEKGMMNGVKDDKFDPHKPLTRAEAAALICRILKEK